jgi:hypothetical protein
VAVFFCAPSCKKKYICIFQLHCPIVILQAILRTNLNNKIDEREKLLEVALNTLEKQSQSVDVVSNIREQLSRFHIDLLLQTLYFVFVLFTSSVFQA